MIILWILIGILILFSIFYFPNKTYRHHKKESIKSLNNIKYNLKNSQNRIDIVKSDILRQEQMIKDINNKQIKENKWFEIE